MFKSITLFLLCSWFGAALAQNGAITGKVIDNKTGHPLAFVNVFLSSATKGTQTDTAGNFSLRGIRPGQYELVISMVGYNTVSRQVAVNDDSQQIKVQLEPKSIQLREISLGPDPNWLRNYEAFKKNFLGSSPNAARCKILNPKDVQVSFENRVLEASSEEFIVIENKALGYHLKYLLGSFTRDFSSGFLYYAGQVLFEEMKGSTAEKKRWKKNREQAYYGSVMHFFRSLRRNDVSEQGFTMRRLERKPNPARPPDSVIRAGIRRFANNGQPFYRDSMEVWMQRSRLSKIVQLLHKDTLQIGDVARRTDQPGLFAITFKDYLYVVYNRKKAPGFDQLGLPPEDVSNHPASIVQLKQPYALFDINGVVTNPQSLIYEGAWMEYVAEMLPNDYEP